MEEEQEKTAHNQSLMQLRPEKNMRKLIDATAADDSTDKEIVEDEVGDDIENSSILDSSVDESNVYDEEYSDFEDEQDDPL
jgi:hypothetical protein